MNNFMPKNATMRHTLVSKGVYLLNHGRNKTSAHYMKDILNGHKPHLKVGSVCYVSVPNYEELSPKNIIESLDLANRDKELY